MSRCSIHISNTRGDRDRLRHRDSLLRLCTIFQRNHFTEGLLITRAKRSIAATCLSPIGNIFRQHDSWFRLRRYHAPHSSLICCYTNRAPDIHYQDTLSGSFSDRFPKLAQNFFDIILANPPFKGSLDFEMFTLPSGPGKDKENGILL